MALTPNSCMAALLDRDGVLIRDVHLLQFRDQIEILPRVIDALTRLAAAKLKLIVVTNQPVVARGLAAESAITEIHRHLEAEIIAKGGPRIDAFYYCPHHPNATDSAYRMDCNCRKPRPGLLMAAAHDHDIDLRCSFMVGDRITDIIAGAKAGCRTVLVQTGAHLAPPIETTEPVDESCFPDHTCPDLDQATKWILEVM